MLRKELRYRIDRFALYNILIAIIICTVNGEDLFSGEVSLLLKNGMSSTDIRMELTCKSDVWDSTASVYFSESYSHSALSPGKIRGLSFSRDTLRLTVAVPSTSSQWAIDVVVSGNQINGAFLGTFMGQTVRGIAHGSVRSAPQGIPLLSSNEHPRLFFKASGMAQIREYAAMSYGKSILEGMKKHSAYTGGYFHGEVAAGFAFRYLMTKDPSDLKSARAWLLRAFNDKSSEHGAHGNKDKVAYAAIAYDLLYNELPATEREAFRFMLLQWALNYNARDLTSPFTAGFIAAGGLAALATLDDPSTMNPKPVSPDVARLISAAKNYIPQTGVPVEEYTSNRMPVNWIYAAAYAPDEDQDPLLPIGGRAGARPVPGNSISSKGRTDQFEYISHPANIYNSQMYALPGIPPADPAFTLYKLPKTTKLPGIAGGAKPSTTEYDGQISYYYCYTVLHVRESVVVKANPNSDGTTYGLSMWLNGTFVRDGEIIRLEKGFYPLMVEMPVMGLWWAPRLSTHTPEIYNYELEKWQKDSADFVITSGKDSRARTALLRCADLVRGYIRTNIGDRGFSNERMGSGEVMNELLPFAAAYRNVTGIDLTAGLTAKLDWVIPLAIATRGEEPPFHTSDAGQLTFWKTMGFPGLIPQEWRGAYKWVLENDGRWGLRNSGQGMFALLNYPHEITAVRPENAGLPRVIIDKVHWNLVARSGYDNARDVGTIFTLGQNQNTHIRAMEFVLQGLGEPSPVAGTIHGPEGFFTSPKIHETNTVRFTGAIPLEGGRPLYLSTAEDGSTIASAVVNHFGKGRIWSTPSQVFGGIGGGVYIEDSTNLGISVFRSIGIDYSGASGAPGLIAVFDKINGGKALDPFVQFRVPNASISGTTIKRTTSSGKVVKISFIYPESVILSSPAKGVFQARGDSVFFYVISVDADPVLQINGSGTVKVVKAGNQTIFFDGDKIRFGVYKGKEQAVVSQNTKQVFKKQTITGGDMKIFDLRGRSINNFRLKTSAYSNNKISAHGIKMMICKHSSCGAMQIKKIVINK